MRYKDRLPLFLFVFSLVFFAFLYGVAASYWGLPPAEQVENAYANARDFQRYWQNDLGIVPTRNLVPSYPGAKRFVMYDQSKVTSGTVLISGLTWGRSAYFGAILLDSSGRELHYWPIDFNALSAARRPENIFLHGLAVFPDGTLVVDSDGGDVLAKIGPCGRPIWVDKGDYTHVVSRSYDGTVWSWKGDNIVQTDVATGRTVQSISLEKDVIEAHGLEGIFWIRTREDPHELLYQNDPFHENDVEVLSPRMAKAFAQFSAGDILVSLRNLNLVAVLDGRTYALKWHQIGPWYRQHDADFQPDGSISIFNNNMTLDHSEIVSIDPQSGRYRVLFRGNEQSPFYSWRRGKHQILGNGNILVTETEHGRVFEVDRHGKLVWEFNNIFDKTRNGVVNKAIHLPPDFFEPGVLNCTVQKR